MPIKCASVRSARSAASVGWESPIANGMSCFYSSPLRYESATRMSHSGRSLYGLRPDLRYLALMAYWWDYSRNL